MFVKDGRPKAGYVEFSIGRDIQIEEILSCMSYALVGRFYRKVTDIVALEGGWKHIGDPA